VVIGPKSTDPSWICCATSRSPPSEPEWWCVTFILPPENSAILSAKRCAACEVPCLGGLTLPMENSWACSANGRAAAAASSALAARRGIEVMGSFLLG
jgi:hypothetical protein